MSSNASTPPNWERKHNAVFCFSSKKNTVSLLIYEPQYRIVSRTHTNILRQRWISTCERILSSHCKASTPHKLLDTGCFSFFRKAGDEIQGTATHCRAARAPSIAGGGRVLLTMLADNEYAVPDKSVCSEAIAMGRDLNARILQKEIRFSLCFHAQEQHCPHSAESSVDSFRRHSLGTAEISVEMGGE